jgi:hypothetical protein
MHVWLEISTWCNSATCTHQKLPRILQVPCSMHPADVREYHYINSGQHELVYDYSDYTEYHDYSSPGRTSSTSTLPCTARTRHSATGSTSTLPCAESTGLSAIAALHQLCRTPPRRRLLGVRLLRLLISTGFN